MLYAAGYCCCWIILLHIFYMRHNFSPRNLILLNQKIIVLLVVNYEGKEIGNDGGGGGMGNKNIVACVHFHILWLSSDILLVEVNITKNIGWPT